MMHSVVLVLLVAVALPTFGYVSVIDEVVQESTSLLHEAENRHKRDIIDNSVGDSAKSEFEWFIQENQTFCFCGKKSWLLNFVKSNLSETEKCINGAKKNITAGLDSKEDFFKNFRILIKASVCAYDCIFNDNGFVNSSGKLDVKKTKDFFMEHAFKEDEVKETGKKVLDRCLNTGTKTTLLSNMLLNVGRGECNEEAYKFVICLLLEMVAECPENLKRNDEQHCRKTYDNFALSRILSKD